jgi:hypothetical protein
LKTLGFKARIEETGLIFGFRRNEHHNAKAKARASAPEVVVREDSPFAKLRNLIPQ